MDIRQLRDDDGEHAALHDLGGDGPPLLLTHGNGLNAGMWATVVPHLRATFHCFGLDFRGHGASRQARERIPVERHWFTAEVLAAVDAIGGGAAPFASCEPEAVWAYVEQGTTPQPDGTVRLTCSGETEASVYETNEQLDFSQFAAIVCPVVVAAGAVMATGNELPPMVAPLVADALGDGRLEVLPGLTHFAP